VLETTLEEGGKAGDTSVSRQEPAYDREQGIGNGEQEPENREQGIGNGEQGREQAVSSEAPAYPATEAVSIRSPAFSRGVSRQEPAYPASSRENGACTEKFADSRELPPSPASARENGAVNRNRQWAIGNWPGSQAGCRSNALLGGVVLVSANSQQPIANSGFVPDVGVSREADSYPGISRERPPSPASARERPRGQRRACPELAKGAGSRATKNSAERINGVTQTIAPQPAALPPQQAKSGLAGDPGLESRASPGGDPSEDLRAGSGATENEAGPPVPPATSSTPRIPTREEREAESIRRYYRELQRRWWSDSNCASWRDLGP
jgi:hypothetical protein